METQPMVAARTAALASFEIMALSFS